MSRFGPDPRAFFEAVYQQPAPWDIGGPQPAMVDLLSEYPPQAPVLDVGCGSGDLTIHIAGNGIPAIGIDFVEEAITQAQSKATRQPADITGHLHFQVADALQPSLLGQSFGAIVDSGFYHLFDRDQCNRFADELRLVLSAGGRYYLHEFAVEFPIPNVPRQVTETELREIFTPERGWNILTIRPAEFLSRVAPVPAILACIERIDTENI